jgi:nitrate reductase gamma subunit
MAPGARAEAAQAMTGSKMDLLVFARGPGLHWALVIMVFGICWRVAVYALARSERDLYWARKQFWLGRGHWQIESYVMHVGLLIVLFGFVPHIQLVRDLTGIGWPGLPIGLVWFAGALTIAAMVAVLIHRPPDEEPRTLRARLDEYFSWLVVLAPLLTGLLAFPHLGGASLTPPWAALLTAHLLSAELLMVWLPFGRLAHLALMPLLRGAARALALMGIEAN